MEIQELQSRASDPEYSVYVNASAGSGKTKVLIDRILRLLLNGTHITKILCVTFTNAAAGEMVERLKTKTKRWLFADLEILSTELSALIKKPITNLILEKARSLYGELLQNNLYIRIQTIHSLCSDILQISTLQTFTKKSSDLISSGEQYNFLFNAYNQALGQEGLQDALRILLARYSHNYLFEIIAQLIKQYAKIYEYFKKFSDARELSQGISQIFGVDLDYYCDRGYELEILNSIDLENILQVANSLIQKDEELGYSLKNWLDLSSEEKLLKIDSYVDRLLTKNYTARLRVKGLNKCSDQEMQIFRNHQQSILEFIYKTQSFQAAKINLAFIQLVQVVFKNYNQLKAKENLIDYDELLLKTIEQLTILDQKDWLLCNLDSAIEHILVDEAQDLNQYQWKIISLLSEEFFTGIGASEAVRTIFIVGDIKQSIFGFQGAAPEIFQDICAYYRIKCRDSHRKWAEIDFNISFRSGNKILKIVDEIFTESPINFGQYQKHVSARNSFSRVEAWPLADVANSSDQAQEQWDLPKATELGMKKYLPLADYICHKIDGWVKNQSFLAGKNKAIEFSDIMIIFRKRGDVYQAISRKLNQLNIPFTSNGSFYLKEQLAILDIISAIKFVLNTNDDYNLAILLKSPFFNLTEIMLFDLVYSHAKSKIWNKILPDKKYSLLHLMIKKYAENSNYEFLYWLVSEYSSLCSLSNQPDTISICNEFLQSFLEFHKQNPFKVIRSFLQQFQKSETVVMSSNSIQSNAVKLVTAHSAKGLQASIVIIADSSESENLSQDKFLWSCNKLFFNCSSLYSEVLQKIKNEHKVKQKVDSIKLFYVAITRAEDELYLCGVQNDKKDSWYQIFLQTLQNASI